MAASEPAGRGCLYTSLPEPFGSSQKKPSKAVARIFFGRGFNYNMQIISIIPGSCMFPIHFVRSKQNTLIVAPGVGLSI